MDNAADRKDVRRREKESLMYARQREDIVRQLMSTAPGRMWMWDTLARCHCFSTTFTSDALTSSFNEGQRSIGLALLAEVMQACPEQYLQAQREHNVRSTIDERRSSPQPSGGDLGPGASADDDPASDYGDPTLGAEVYNDNVH